MGDFMYATIKDLYTAGMGDFTYATIKDRYTAGVGDFTYASIKDRYTAGVGDFMYATIKDRYTKPNAHMRVKINDKLSDPFRINVGVNQSDQSSCTLFKLYINDTIQYFDNECAPVTLGNRQISCLLCADDCYTVRI